MNRKTKIEQEKYKENIKKREKGESVTSRIDLRRKGKKKRNDVSQKKEVLLLSLKINTKTKKEEKKE